MRRLRNSVKAIIATVCVVAVLVGVVVGIIIHNNNKKPNNPGNIVSASQLNDLADDINNSYEKINYEIFTEAPYNGICEYENLITLTDKYFIFNDPNTGYDIVYFYIKNADGTYTYKDLTKKTSDIQSGFVHKDAVDYSIEFYNENYILIKSILEYGIIVDGGISTYDRFCYDVIYISDKEAKNIFSIDNIDNDSLVTLISNISLFDGYLSFATANIIDQVNNSIGVNIYFYRLGTSIINLEDDLLYSLENINSSDYYDFNNNNNNFVISLKDKIIIGIYDNEKFIINEKFVKVDNNGNILCNYYVTYLNKNAILIQEKIITNVVTTNSVYENGNYYNNNYYLLSLNNNSIKEIQIKLNSGYGKIISSSISDNSTNFYICQQKLKNNKLVDEYVSQYITNAGELIFEYSSDYNEKIKYIDSNYCLTQNRIFLLVDKVTTQDKLNFSQSGISPIISQLNSQFFICSYNGYYTIMNVKGEFIIDPSVILFTKIYSISREFAIGYIDFDDYSIYYLIDISNKTFAQLENFYEDAIISASLDNGSSIYLTQQVNGKFTLCDYNTILFDDIYRYNILRNDSGIMIQLFDESENVFSSIKIDCKYIDIENYNYSNKTNNYNDVSTYGIFGAYRTTQGDIYLGDTGEKAVWYFYHDQQHYVVWYNWYDKLVIELQTPNYYITNFTLDVEFHNIYQYTITSSGPLSNVSVTSNNNNHSGSAYRNSYGGITYDWGYREASYSGGLVTHTGPTQDNYTLKWKVNYRGIDCTLEFNENGGNSVSDATIEYGQTYYLSDFVEATKTGWTFTGWYDSLSGGSLVNSFTCTGNKTVYAQWTPNVYNISYNYNGGEKGGNDPTTVTFDDDFTVNAPTRTGYTFDGWSISGMKSGLTKEYGTSSSNSNNFGYYSTTGETNANENWFLNLHSNSGATVYFNAKWIENNYYIRFEFANYTSSDFINGYEYLPNANSGFNYDSVNPINLKTSSDFSVSFNGSSVSNKYESNRYYYYLGGTDNRGGKDYSFDFEFVGLNGNIRRLIVKGETIGKNWYDILMDDEGTSDAHNDLITLQSSFQIAAWLLKIGDKVVDPLKTNITLGELIDDYKLGNGGQITFVAAYLPKSYFVDVGTEYLTGGSTSDQNKQYQINTSEVDVIYQVTAKDDDSVNLGTRGEGASIVIGQEFNNKNDRTITGDRFDVKSMGTINLTISIQNIDDYRLKQIEIQHFGYIESGTLKTATIYIDIDDGGNTRIYYRVENSSGNPTGNELTNFKRIGTQYYLGSNSNYNKLSYSYNNSTSSISISVEDCYYAHDENNNNGSGYVYNENTVNQDGLFGFKVIARARSNYYLGNNTFSSTSDSENGGDGSHLALNVQPIQSERGDGNTKYYIWINGVRYRFSNSNLISNYYYKLDTNGTVNQWKNTVSDSEFGSNVIYVVNSPTWLAYYYAGNSENSSATNRQNHNNTQIIAVKPNQQKISAVDKYSGGSSSSRTYYDLLSYLSAVTIDDGTYYLSLSRAFTGSTELGELTLTINNGWGEVESHTLNSISYRGTTYTVLQEFEITIDAKGIINLYFARNNSNYEVMYFFYIDRTSGVQTEDNLSFQFTFSNFNNEINVAVGPNDANDKFDDSEKPITYQFNKNGISTTGNTFGDIQPANTSYFKFAPNDGYIISSIVVRLDLDKDGEYESTLFNLGLNNNSFTLNENYQYYYASGGVGSASYHITYNRTGLNYLSARNILDSNGNSTDFKYGIYFAEHSSVNWVDDNATEHGIETFYLMISGIYGNIQIDVKTKSYVEFDFNAGDINNQSYNQLLEINTNTGISERIHILVNNNGWNDVFDMSNVDGLLVRTSNIDSNQVYRVIFVGEANLLKNGFKIFATGSDYSLYFTNPLVYNYDETTSSNSNPFKSGFGNIGELEGRKTTNAHLNYEEIRSNDLLTYIYMRGSRDKANKYVDFFSIVKTMSEFESAKKYLLLLNIAENQVTLTTNSYISNANLGSYYDATEQTGQLSYSETGAQGQSVYYNNDKTNDLYFSWRYTSGNQDRTYYQLDYTYNDYNKVGSWFNNTALTNIDININDTTLNWQNIDKEKTGLNTSYHDQKVVPGYKLQFKYYEIPGYYLQYIDIVTVDYGITSINVTSIKNNYSSKYPDQSSLAVQIRGARIYVKISYVYDGNNPYYLVSFYSTENSNENYNAENAIALLSNSFSVNFYSMANNVNIVYHENYGESSTKPEQVNTLKPQSFPYDSMTELTGSLSMDGYTFIGWGSQNFDGDNRVDDGFNNGINRYDSTSNTWNSTSSWFNATQYFDYSKRKELLEFNNLTTQLSFDFYIKSSGNQTYFLTDTGNTETENYNFWAAYATIFMDNVGGSALTYTIDLYGIWKANSYILAFDFNDSDAQNGSTKGQISYRGSDFFEGQVAIGNLVLGIINNSEIYFFYVTFDSSNWYAMNAQTATNEIKSAYLGHYESVDQIFVQNNQMQYVIDRYGYSWLGWYFNKKSNAFEDIDSSFNSQGVLFGSKYYSSKLNQSGITLPVLNKSLLNEFNQSGNINDNIDVEFKYYNKNNNNMYAPKIVVFYRYDTGTQNVSTNSNILPGTISVKVSEDYLNSKVGSDKYGFIPGNNQNYLSYFDTSVAYSSYGFDGDNYLYVNRGISENNRYLMLYAYWEVNKYTAVIDWRDNTVVPSLDHIGSTDVTNKSNSEFTIWAYFDDDNENVYNEILGYIFNYQTFNYQLNNANPARVGYDFLGWSLFFYDGDYASTPNSTYNPSDLNKGNVVYSTSYEFYNLNNTLVGGIYFSTSGVGLVPLYTNNSMIANGSSFNDYQEILGRDKDSGGAEKEATHYIYIFALWKKQTFYANISLNIDQEELLNLYEQDSRFALAIYNSANLNSRNYLDYSLAINSNNLKDSLTNANLTYKDIVANLNIVFVFDELVKNGYISVNGTKYYLHDLFAVSTGYYFLGWLLKSDDPNSLVVGNTLKTTFANDGKLDNINPNGYSDVGQILGDSWSADDLVFDYAFYQKLFRSNYKSPTDTRHDFNSDNMTSIEEFDASGASSNFGYVTINGINCYIASEENTNDKGEISYYLYFKYKGTKYYVRFYNSVGSDSLSNDHEFLYYSSNKYAVSFDSDGNAYYITTEGSKYTLNDLKINVYRSNGSINNAYNESLKVTVIDGSGISFKCLTTRQFTLYAHWQIKDDFVISMGNGNNASGDDANSTSNPGLSGYYTIQDSDNGAGVAQTSTEKEFGDDDTYSSLDYTFDFYHDLAFDIIPYYNGRFLSEMSFTFYRIEEYTQGTALKFRTSQHILTFKFSWDNENKKIVLQNVSRVTNGATSTGVGFLPKTADDGSQTIIFNDTIVNSLLSILDSSSVDEGFNITNYAETSTDNYASTYGRRDVNRVYFNFTDVMSNIEISCKFSIQTFQVDFYNILDDNGDTLSLKEGTINVYETTFNEESFNAILSSMNLDDPNYVLRSNLSYGLTKIATISNDVAQTSSSVSYNVPYGYFLYGNYYSSSIVGNRPVDDPDAVGQAYNGYEYIYANGYYNYGSTTTPITSNGTDSYYDQCSPILGNKVAFPTKSMRLDLSFYSFKGWYEYSLDRNKNVLFTEYVQESEATYINRNITLYGYYYAMNRPTNIQFYTWDDDTNSYTAYNGNTEEYTLNSNTENSPFINENGTLIPKEEQIEYVDDSNYAKINISVQYGFDGLGLENKYTVNDFNDDRSSGGYDYNTLRTLLRTYWFYEETYEVFYFENVDDSKTYICYDEESKDFYYVDENNQKVSVEITTVDNENFYYNVKGNSTKIKLEREEKYRYNYPGAKLYIRVSDADSNGRYYELKEIVYNETVPTNAPESTDWVLSRRPRYYVDVEGDYYYWLPIMKDSSTSAPSTTIYNGEGSSTGLSFTYSIQTLDAYYIIYNNEYYEVVYPTANDEYGSPYVNPETMPGEVTIPVRDDYIQTYYLNFNNKTLCTSADLLIKVDFEHRVYCPVNDNYTINVSLTAGSGGTQSWTSSGITINSLPSPNIGFWYNSEEYGFIGYIYMTDAILTDLKANASDSESGEVTQSGAIYTEFSDYIDIIYDGYDQLYIENLKRAVAERVSEYSLEDFLSALLIANSYVYDTDGSTINFINVNVPITFENIEFLDENNNLQTVSLSVVVEVQFNIISRQTVVSERIYAIPIYSPYVMDFTTDAVKNNEIDSTQIDIESTEMNVWHFERAADTTHVYNRENGDYLQYIVLDKDQYTELYNNSQNIADYLTKMINSNKYVDLTAESADTSNVSLKFAVNSGEYFVLSFYYKTGSNDYVVRVSDNMLHINSDGNIRYNITTMQEYGLGA